MSEAAKLAARERARIWYHENKERYRAGRQARMARVLESNRRSKAKNAETRLAKERERYQRLRGGLIAKQRAYYLANREAVLAYQRIAKYRRRARAAGAGPLPTPSALAALRASYCGLCAYCLKRPARLHNDHVVPLAAGGTNDIENFAPACRSCNSSKGAKPLMLFLATRAQP